MSYYTKCADRNTLCSARLLRQNLLNPLTSIDEIQTRLESVEFLIANEQLSGELSSGVKMHHNLCLILFVFLYLLSLIVLAQFQDVDVVLSRFSENNI